jgi:hypothetical protein
VDELFEYIESLEFASKTNLANNFRMFVRALALDGAQARLFALAQLGDHAQSILSRVKYLAEVRSDLEYENPGDSALATYLRVLYYASPRLALEAAVLVADAPRLWWADFVSRAILRDRDAISQSAMIRGQVFSFPEVGSVEHSIELPVVRDKFWDQNVWQRGIGANPMLSLLASHNEQGS